MTTTAAGAAAEPRWPLATIAAWGLGLTVALYVCPLALDLPLLDPDEGLHASIALEMVERADYVTPRFLGEPFLDKPVLFFWAQALSLRALGASEVSIRLVGLAFGWLGAVTTGLVAWRLSGTTAAMLAAAFYATMLLPMALSQFAVHDVALVPWVNLAVIAFHEAVHGRATRQVLQWSAFAGLWLGLAILTKGLVGVALVGVAVALWSILSRRLSIALAAGGAVALLVAVLVATPWYLAMDRENPGYLRYFFLERHLLGFTTTTQRHGTRPLWYYVPIVAGGGIPWVVYAARRRLALEAASDRGGRALAWSWLAGGLAFLSAASSKLVTYVLPLFPAIAVLAAGTWRDDLADPGRSGRAGLARVTLMSWTMAIVPAAGLAVASRQFHAEYGGTAWLSALVLAAAWLSLPRTLWQRGGPAPALAAAIALAAVSVLVGMAVVLPPVARIFSARDLAGVLNAQGRFPDRLWILDERVGSLVFYLAPALRAELTPDRVVNVRLDVLLRIRRAPAGLLVAIPVEQLDRLGSRLDLSQAPFVDAGAHRLYTGAAIAEAVRRTVVR